MTEHKVVSVRRKAQIQKIRLISGSQRKKEKEKQKDREQFFDGFERSQFFHNYLIGIKSERFKKKARISGN